MNVKRFVLLLFIILGTMARKSSAQTPDGTQAMPHPVAAEAAHPVVVELFTSQGCSSCPPADVLLTKLGAAPAGQAAPVIPLEFHVDYWNHVGWTDPFSSRTWTERQVGYMRAFHLDAPYTPQAVVDGAAQVVGSDADALRGAIAAAEKKPAAGIALHLQPEASRVSVDADVTLPESLRGRRWDLLVAVFETGLVTPVGKGENGGRTLHNDYVVRSLTSAGKVEKPSRLKATLKLEKDWDRSRLGVAAFLQDPKSLEIRGASVAPLSSTGAAPAGAAP
ncbi:MAG TPA: DUF1223 domain-containing protein [Thermoanaerobaculia bacterium]